MKTALTLTGKVKSVTSTLSTPVYRIRVKATLLPIMWRCMVKHLKAYVKILSMGIYIRPNFNSSVIVENDDSGKAILFRQTATLAWDVV